MDNPVPAAADIRVAASVVEAARGLRRTDRCAVLGIAGAPAAGKSTLAAALSEALGLGGDIPAQDGFHLANRQLARLQLADCKGAPETFDGDGYRHLLARVAACRRDAADLYAPGFNRAIEEPIAAACRVRPADGLVLTEGNYLLLAEPPWPAVRACLDAVWYLHCEREPREARLLARHQRYGTSAERARAWMQATDRPNAERIEAAAARADRRLVWAGNHVAFAAATDRNPEA